MSAARTEIPGYTYGTSEAARSPVTEEELANLEAAALFTEDDARYLRMAGEILADQVEDVLDVWYGFVAAHPFLVHSFSGPDGQPDASYLAAVRRRFGRWILDTCERPHDRAWIDYQEEIALRHHRSKKNRTDGVSSVPQVPLRYVVALIAPIALTIRDFLARKGHDAADVERMHQAWLKAVVLQVALWSRPYAGPDW
jgi:hypothetical protein